MASNNKVLTIVRYHECRRTFGNPGVFDGCQEFINIAGGQLCDACGCQDSHRRVETPLADALIRHARGDPPTINLSLQDVFTVPDLEEEPVVVNPRRRPRRG